MDRPGASPAAPAGVPDTRDDDGLIERAIGRYSVALRVFLRTKLGSFEDEVEDAAQETWERLLRYRHVQQAEIPRALVMRIATSVVADRAGYNASRQAHRHMSVDDVELVSADATPERCALAGEDIAIMAAAIPQMPARCRDVFLLSRVKGMKHHEIASLLGISVKAVEKNIARALAVCRHLAGTRPR